MSEDERGGIERILDANLNRLREGIRVIEDIVRYAHNDATNSYKLKALRHKIRLNLPQLLTYRDVNGDVAQHTTQAEQVRMNLAGVLIANFKRTQESARVLEEMIKLIDIHKSEDFKQIRYELYELERVISQSGNPSGTQNF